VFIRRVKDSTNQTSETANNNKQGKLPDGKV
jgi:hypothetical protein